MTGVISACDKTRQRYVRSWPHKGPPPEGWEGLGSGVEGLRNAAPFLLGYCATQAVGLSAQLPTARLPHHYTYYVTNLVKLYRYCSFDSFYRLRHTQFIHLNILQRDFIYRWWFLMIGWLTWNRKKSISKLLVVVNVSLTFYFPSLYNIGLVCTCTVHSFLKNV